MKKKTSITPLKTSKFDENKIEAEDKNGFNINFANFFRKGTEQKYREKYIRPIVRSIYHTIKNKYGIEVGTNCRYALVYEFGSETKIMNYLDENISKERLEKIVANINEDSKNNIDDYIYDERIFSIRDCSISDCKKEVWKNIQDEFISFIKDNDKVIPEKENIVSSNLNPIIKELDKNDVCENKNEIKNDKPIKKIIQYFEKSFGNINY